jgi:hypothetical protein
MADDTCFDMAPKSSALNMNDKERQKRHGHKFIQRLRSECLNAESFEAVVREFASDSSENRLAVAMSLLAIGADQSEKVFDRNFALSQLGMLIRTCGLRGNIDVQKRLNNIIDEWIFNWPDQNAPWGALSALGRVNRQVGLEKCDYLIDYYGDSEAGRQIHQLRNGIERLNPSE